MLRNILIGFQIGIPILLIIIILFQGKGVGLSNVFGGTGNVYRTKRGAEKVLHYITIVLVFLFFVVAFLSLIIK